MKNLLVVILLWFLASCSSKEQNLASSEELSTSIELSTVLFIKHPIILKKTCPHSRCKSYTIKLHDSQLFLQVEPPHKRYDTKVLSQAEIKQFNRLLDDLNLRSIKTGITPNSPTCPSHSSDSPNYDVSINKGNLSQELEIYTGCHNLAKKYLSFIDWFESKSRNSAEF